MDDLILNFEAQAQIDENGVQFWLARDLQTLLDYDKWENFKKVISKAQIACEQSGQNEADHWLPDVRKSMSGKGREETIEDYRLTRYACYLIAQNGDPRKKTVSFAQTYFAIQTRRQELEDQKIKTLSSDEKRILLRNEMKHHNKALADAAKNSGVIKPLDYAIFQNHGYQGLYNGLNRQGIQEKKGLKPNQDILDYMGSEELAANLFRATQAEAKLRRENIQGKSNANRAHFEVGKKVRETIQELGGTMPEALPTEEDVKKLARRVSGDSQKEVKSAKGFGEGAVQ